MATSTVTDHYKTIERTSPDISEQVPLNVCAFSNFPDKFQDFFAELTEDGDDLPSMLEDKLIPKSTINHFYEELDLCKSGVGLATAMLQLLRREGIGDFGLSTLL